MGNILTAGGFVPTTTDTPLDARTRVATFAKIADIENPYKLMRITVEDTGKTYEVRKLTSKVIGGITVGNAAIDINDADALFDLGKGEEERSEAETIRQENEAKRISAEEKRTLAESNRQGAESDREKAELARAKSESSRDSAETNRQSAETARSNKESERISNESARVSAESKRASNEETRISNENARKTSESQRQTEEYTRVSNEAKRIKAENDRVSNENNRIVAEGKRDAAEKARANAESTRNSNEELRKTTESGRVTAEQGRVEAEIKRGTDFDTLKSEMQTAIDEGKEATKETIAATEGLDAVVEEQNAKLTELASEVESNAFIRQLNDKNGNFIFGIKADGSIEWAVGVPAPIKRRFTEFALKNREINALIEEVNTNINNLGIISEEDPFFIEKHIDYSNDLVYGIRGDGQFVFGKFPLQIKNFVKKELSNKSDKKGGDIIYNMDDTNNIINNYNSMYPTPQKPVFDNIVVDKIINITNQDEFSRIRENVNSFISDNNGTTLLIKISNGIYKGTINLNDVNTDKNIIIEGSSNTLIVNYNRLIKIEDTNRYVNYYKAQCNETFDVNKTSYIVDGTPCLYSINPLENSFENLVILEEQENNNVYCKIKVNHRDLTSYECSDMYIKFSSGYYFYQYKIEKIEDGYAFFLATNVRKYTIGWAIDLDRYYGVTLRYSIINDIDKIGTDIILYQNNIYVPYKFENLYIVNNNQNNINLQNSKFGVIKINNISFYGGLYGVFANNLNTQALFIEYCKFADKKDNGIYANNVPSVIIQNCDMNNMFKGMFIYGANSNAYISNNRLKNIGIGAGQVMSVSVSVKSAYVGYNTICNFSYAAISSGVLHDTPLDTHSIIEYNELFNSQDWITYPLNTLCDSGAIYVVKNTNNAIIRYNKIHDIQGKTINYGIFCDNGSVGAVIYDNLLYNIFGGRCIDLRKADDINYETNMYNFIGRNIMVGNYRYETKIESNNKRGYNIQIYNDTLASNSLSGWEDQKDCAIIGYKIINDAIYVGKESYSKILEEVNDVNFLKFINYETNL